MGNDIVDLTDPETINKYRDTRFISRVFTSKEHKMIELSSEPNRTLWMIWASKEAMYKIVNKNYAYIPFSPKLFQVAKIIGGEPFFHVQVCYKKTSAEIKVKKAPSHIHAFGEMTHASPHSNDSAAFEMKMPSDDFRNLRNLFTEDEWKSVQSPESAWVRYFAKKELTKRWRVPFEELAIIRDSQNAKYGPPIVYRENVLANVDISFSHHGKWIAWALSALPEARNS